MSLTRLLIKDFRNIESADLALSPGFNFLVGANGSGKTSVLEAIYTLGHGRAFRSLQIGRVIRHEQDAFVLHGRLQGEERETAIGLTKDKQGDSKVRIDGTDGHKVAELAHLMPMQLITPEGFTLLNGGPKYRRAFLDWGCFHNEAGFFTAWSNLEAPGQAAQRRAASGQPLCPAAALGSGINPAGGADQPLACRIQRRYRRRHGGYLSAIFTGIHAHLLFPARLGKETDYAEVLERNFERDRMLTYTAHGPHKADFRIRADGAPVEDTLSRGQLSC
ncbi:DNA replication/repair protein RecF [Klebsiella pneumoniae subsp. pneumoniae]|nr:DNA replication/repair protein RecF [Klebsiella pneumoniae subsp. pneumoniae]